ncbi:hypothetical protein PMAYCL1PPCAC_15525, partial [Pristionchus mayeri]
FSSSKTRFLYGSTHPTVSQSSIAGRLMQEGDLFVGAGFTGKGEATRIIKVPNQSFKINGLHYYWDPVFVPPDCKSARKSPLPSNGVVESSTRESPTTTPRPSTLDTPLSHPRNALVNLLPPTPMTTEGKRNSSTSVPSTSLPKTSSSTPPSTSSSISTSKSRSPIPLTSTKTTTTASSSTPSSKTDVDLVVEFLQSLHSSNSDNVTITFQVPRARRQAVGYRFSSTTPTTTLPTPIRPHVDITEVDPCFNVGDGSPEVCTRLLDRRDDRDPLMHIAFPNGTKVAELAWRCPVGLFCCEWECCEMRQVKRRHSVLPFLIAAVFIIVAVFICIFCFRSYKEGEERRRNINQMAGPNDYQMTVTNPPQVVEREEFDDGPRMPPPVPRTHFHVHDEPRFVPPPVPPSDRLNGTYR